MSLYNKKTKELEVCLFFANQYYAESLVKSDNEDEEGDCILHLPNEKIKIQLISCDHEILPIMAKSQKNEGEFFDVYRDRKDNILHAINKKSTHYDKKILKNMILLIHSENISINHEFIIKETKTACKNSNYKNIFFIRTPDNETKKTYPTNKGDIIQLK